MKIYALKELTNLSCKWCEDEVRDFILDKIKDRKFDEIIEDSGHIIVQKGREKSYGGCSYDLVGFIISSITNDGCKFETVYELTAKYYYQRGLNWKDKPRILGQKQ